jgi:hypothetical protein
LRRLHVPELQGFLSSRFVDARPRTVRRLKSRGVSRGVGEMNTPPKKRSQIRQVDVGTEFEMLIALLFHRRFARLLLNFSGLVNRGHPYRPVMKNRCRA